MNLRDTVYFGCAAYSSIHPHRAAELNHLFFTIGNGYDWIDGELVEGCGMMTYKNGKTMSLSAAISKTFRDRKKRNEWRKRDERNRKRREKRNPPKPDPTTDAKISASIDRAIAEMKAAKEKDPVAFEAQRKKFEADWKESKRRWRAEQRYEYRIPEDIDQRVSQQTIQAGAYDGYNHWYPMSEKYSACFDYDPATIKDDWLQGIIEACKLLLATPPVPDGRTSSVASCAETVRLATLALEKAIALAQKRGIKGHGEEHLTLKVGQRVQIVKTVPWTTQEGATMSRPSVGLKGKVADPKKYPYPKPQEGRTAVILKSTDLGYEPWDKDHATQVRYIPTECLKAI